MKQQTTLKQIKNDYQNRIAVPYCHAHYLLTYREPNYYTSGVYGWNNDIYYINYTTCVITGYRYLMGTINYDYKTLDEYNNKAKNIISNNNLSDETKKDLVNSLLNEWINSILF